MRFVIILFKKVSIKINL